ncbi:MAG: SLC13 family permease [Actinobacteria bacterium]|nr:SLC13 family permease [Actinomycetota bacterium]
MTLDAWLTLVVTIGVLVMLITSGLSPAVIIVGGVLVLYVLDVINTQEAFAGFANPAPITVGALYVLAGAVEKTGALTPLLRRTMGNHPSLRIPLLRTLFPASAASAFLNNTPIVALLIPQATSWAARRGISVAQLLMPISFAAILGGTVTLIGSSTNLVVSGQMAVSGLEPMGFFEITAIGLPLAVSGVFIIVILAPLMLPNRKSIRSEMSEGTNNLTVEMIVTPGGPVDGLSVREADLRGLDGVYLALVDRGHTTVAPARPETVLLGGDRLLFVGDARNITDLELRAGIRFAENDLQPLDLDEPDLGVFEVVVGPESPLIQQSLQSADFRSNYQASVLAIQRDGELVQGKLGEVELKVGDTLILITDSGFRKRWTDRADFLLVASMSDDQEPVAKDAWLPIGVLFLVVALAATGIMPIVQGALIGAVLMVVLGVLTPLEARRSVDVEVLVVIAAAFGLAAAMQSTGLADQIAELLTNAFVFAGGRGVLLGIVIATVVMTEVITNNAAALLMLPIAIVAAEPAGLDPRGVAIAVAVMASASFLTPIGYQTNTMVLGPGGYRFGDYIKFGFPLTLLAIVLVVVLVPMIWPAPI